MTMILKSKKNKVPQFVAGKHSAGLENCADCVHIIANNGSVLKTVFKKNGKTYEIIGTEDGKYSKKVLACIDTWKCRETGEIFRWERSKLYHLTR